MESAVLYSCWAKLPIRSGTEKRTIPRKGSPDVISCTPKKAFPAFARGRALVLGSLFRAPFDDPAVVAGVLNAPLYLDSVGTILTGALGNHWGKLVFAVIHVFWFITLFPLILKLLGIMEGQA